MLLDGVIHEYLTFIGRDSLLFKLEVHQINKLNGPKGKRIGGIREINIGLNVGKSNTNTCAEVQSLSKNGEGLIGKREVVYQWRVKPTKNMSWRAKENVAGLVAGSSKSGQKEAVLAELRQVEANSRVQEGCNDGVRMVNVQSKVAKLSIMLGFVQTR